jgi:hypothetical protein
MPVTTDTHAPELALVDVVGERTTVSEEFEAALALDGTWSCGWFASAMALNAVR